MLDGILLERRGLPSAVICTDIFRETGRAMAEQNGAPDYPFVSVPHPIASATEEELAERARRAMPEVVEILRGAFA